MKLMTEKHVAVTDRLYIDDRGMVNRGAGNGYRKIKKTQVVFICRCISQTS